MEGKKPSPDPEFVLRTKGGSVTCISDGGEWDGCTVILVGSADGTISIWDMETKRPVRCFSSSSKTSILSLARLGYHKILSHDREGHILLWNLSSNDAFVEDQFKFYQFGFCPCTVIRNDEEILIGFQANSDSQLDVMNLSTKQIVCQLKPTEKLGMIMHARLFKCKETENIRALIVYEDGSVGLWDVSNRALEIRLKTHQDAVMCIDLDSECARAVVGSADNTLVQVAINQSADKKLEMLRTVELKSQGVASLRIRQDRKIFACGCWDGKVRVFGWKKLKPLAVLQYHSEIVNCIEFTSDNTLLCGSKDGKISMWKIYNEI